jgi:uncharacterized membrane protein YuzA (DUF378 family)
MRDVSAIPVLLFILGALSAGTGAVGLVSAIFGEGSAVDFLSSISAIVFGLSAAGLPGAFGKPNRLRGWR